MSRVFVLGVILAFGFGVAETGRGQTTPSEANPGWVDVSQSLGFPLGGLGTGYSAFGQYGFVRVNFEGRPHDNKKAGMWEYTDAQAREQAVKYLDEAKKQLAITQKNQAASKNPKILANHQQVVDDCQRLLDKVNSPTGFSASTFGFVLREGDTTTILQTNSAPWLPNAATFEKAVTTSFLPKGRVVFSSAADKLTVQVDAFTPLLPHDLATATLPVQVYDLTVENNGANARQISLSLENSIDGQAVANTAGRVVFASPMGQLAFAGDGAKASSRAVTISLQLPPGAKQTARFYVAWYYPKIEQYRRYYARDHADASTILDLAAAHATEWSHRIDAWHDSLDVPAYLKRLWFSSLSPVMCSTYLTTDPYFFEIETPHPFVNTMDVFVYANWVYMINWPELERMDMEQFEKAIPTDGPKTGFVPHSLWKDGADYAEEPTFLVRARRDELWFNDPALTRGLYTDSVAAANRAFSLGAQEGLVVSQHGNQSYDVWKMPGISSYVNCAWIYGLASLEKTARSLGQPMPTVGGQPVDQLLRQAVASYDKLLWNPATKSWNLFYRTEGADKDSSPDTLFTDQLFGRWVLAIDPAADTGVLSAEKIRQALESVYANNLVADHAQNFRGWVDGMKPGHLPDVHTGYHARTFWLGPQINLGSLLGLAGNEKASLDVMRSIEMSLGANQLAVGEWNRAIDANGGVQVLPQEPEKDTPRFAPYPRYSSCWEYLVRLLGLRLDEKHLSLAPFTSLDFNIGPIPLAGMKLTVHVQRGWTKAEVDHHPVGLPLTLERADLEHEVDFIK